MLFLRERERERRREYPLPGPTQQIKEFHFSPSMRHKYIMNINNSTRSLTTQVIISQSHNCLGKYFPILLHLQAVLERRACN